MLRSNGTSGTLCGLLEKLAQPGLQRGLSWEGWGWLEGQQDPAGSWGQVCVLQVSHLWGALQSKVLPPALGDEGGAEGVNQV